MGGYVDEHVGAYFGGVIACITCVVFLIAFLVYLRERYYPFEESRTKTFFELSGAAIISGREWSIFLFAFRLSAFLYFLCVGWSWNWSVEGVVEGPNNAYEYFTNWNIVFICITFLLLTICSGMNIFCTSEHPIRSDPRVELFAKNAVRVHDVAGTCAFFITVVNFAALDSSDRMWNMIAHATNSIFMFFELFVNGLRPSMHSYLWNLAWLYFYLIFSWGLTGTGVKAIPYFFFATDSATSFGWYLGLLLLHFIFFMVWIYFGVAKFWLADAVFGIKEDKKADQGNHDADTTAVIASNGVDESGIADDEDYSGGKDDKKM